MLRPETGVGAPPWLKIFRECVCVCVSLQVPHTGSSDHFRTEKGRWDAATTTTTDKRKRSSRAAKVSVSVRGDTYVFD